MKIQLVSDLHLEFGPIEIDNAGADILVLSGDICVADYFKRGPESPYAKIGLEWVAWFEHTCAKFNRVYYILGNHEHYKGRFYETFMVLQERLGHIINLIILDNAFDVYEGFAFVGTTLWTNFDRDNYKAMLVRDGMNDFKLIEGNNYRKLTPANVVGYHDEALGLIEKVVANYDNVIVLGHHAPSYQSLTPEYATGQWAHLNSGYCSHLDPFIERNRSIKLWTHGHVHSSHDYMIGDTRIVANPRGYARKNGTNENADFNPNLILEV